MARHTPVGTMAVDNSINESMTRWIVLHATQDVLLARNVGWKSIGHGFYLEEATEVNNKLFSNLGVFARAAVIGHDDAHLAEDANPRKVPGILAQRIEVAPNPITPRRKIRRRPNRSLSEPPIRISELSISR